VQIEKHSELDGMKAIQAAFEGHLSCKHVYVVDADIDIYDPLAVEWAFATRFQGDRDMLVLEKSPGSSLDPSADPGEHITTRVGFDLTKPLDFKGKDFNKAVFPQVDLGRFLKDGKV
jgi:UbiD family decarboxylase